ncbi:MAG: hypothetical protein IJV03_01740 [Alphaproteobacteria bacterium]|nr:hypothetical protein [Alphaproteobacteria bacterium]
MFYHVFLGERKKLNWNCAQFNNSEIDLFDFVSATTQIESDVNLYRRVNQKKFIEKSIIDLREIYPDESKSFLKNLACKMLKKTLINQERRNLMRAKPGRIYFQED